MSSERNIAIHDAIKLIADRLPKGWYQAGSAKDKMVRVILYLRGQEKLSAKR